MSLIDFLNSFLLGAMAVIVISAFMDLKRSQWLTRDMRVHLEALQEQAKELISVAEQKRKDMFDKEIGLKDD